MKPGFNQLGGELPNHRRIGVVADRVDGPFSFALHFPKPRIIRFLGIGIGDVFRTQIRNGNHVVHDGNDSQINLHVGITHHESLVGVITRVIFYFMFKLINCILNHAVGYLEGRGKCQDAAGDFDLTGRCYGNIVIGGEYAGKLCEVKHVIAVFKPGHARRVGQIIKRQRFARLSKLLVKKVWEDIKLVGISILVILDHQQLIRPVVGTDSRAVKFICHKKSSFSLRRSVP